MDARWPLILALLSIATMAPPAFADPRTAFVGKHRCAIVARLDEIHRRGPRDRFVTVALVGAPQSYVQCIFFDVDTKMFCEASSGAYGARLPNGLPPKLPDGAVAALTALGYTLENPNENFHREIDIGSPPDLDAVAELMLSALQKAYGAGLDSRLEITAPKARKTHRGCEPTATLARAAAVGLSREAYSAAST